MRVFYFLSFAALSITSHADDHRIEVIEGEGSGIYAAGSNIPIVANKPQNGFKFGYWSAFKNKNEDPVQIDDIYSPITNLTIPEHDSYIEAHFVNETFFEVRVRRGATDGFYPVGEKVNIEANTPPDGAAFSYWSLLEGDPSVIEDVFSPRTMITIPSERIEVKAIWRDIYSLRGEGANLNGKVESRTVFTINSSEKVVGKWNVFLDNPSIVKGILKGAQMRDSWKGRQQYELRVKNGIGSGGYPSGKLVPIVAYNTPPGQMFNKWKVNDGDPGIVVDINSAMTSLRMPARGLTLKATYKIEAYDLKIMGGLGSGSYSPGELVSIVADNAPVGHFFQKWKVSDGDSGILADFKSASTSLNMPADRVVIKSIYKEEEIQDRGVQEEDPTHKLQVLNGVGSGSYPRGELIYIIADKREGKIFKKWEVKNSNQDTIADIRSASTILSMPTKELIVKARYREA